MGKGTRMVCAVSVHTNNYVALCGATKHINSDDDKTLKLWYKLHRRKCSICKDRPYRVNNEHIIDATTTEGQALTNVVKGDAIMSAQRNDVFKRYLSIKDRMTAEQREKMREVALMPADDKAEYLKTLK